MTHKKVLFVFVLLSLVYVGQAFVIPPESSALIKYNLTVTQAQLLRLTITLPIVAIWGIALYGYSKFKTYVHTIKDSYEGDSMNELVNGLLFLALWLPLQSIISNTASYIYRHYPSLTAPTVIIRNYIALTIMLLAFYCIYRGARKLALPYKQNISKAWSWGGSLVFTILSGLYLYLSLNNPARQFPSENVPVATFYLPDWLIFSTILVPYLLAFYLGLKAAQYLHTYRAHTKGSIYKQALEYLANGIVFTVISFLSVRFLASLADLFSSLGLKLVLVVIYILLILIAVGYSLIALGAKKLQKIEEI